MKNELKTIFRSYDIRGEYGKYLTEEMAYLIGLSFGGHFIHNKNRESDNKKTCIGFDCRNSSKALYTALTQGLLESHVDIINLGLVPTPLAYFADKIINPVATIIITGSHNRKEDNGFKFVYKGNSFFGEQISNLYDKVIDRKIGMVKYVPNDDFVRKAEKENRYTKNNSTYDQYIEHILSIIKDIDISLKVAWDPGNGATSDVLNLLTQKMSNTNVLINSEMDGNFPSHHPDPTNPENLSQLIDTVKSNNCDIGIAFDGDGDRIGVVTKQGNILYGEHLMMIFSDEIISKNPRSIILTDVKTSETAVNFVEKMGAKVMIYKTGHSWIKSKMKFLEADFASEMSGHIFFKENFYHDDGIYAAFKLIGYLSKKNVSIQDLYNKLPKFYSIEPRKIPIKEEFKTKIIDIIKSSLIKEDYIFSDIDGVRVSTSIGWWLIRASNTESVLIVRCESFKEQNLGVIEKEMYNFLESALLQIN